MPGWLGMALLVAFLLVAVQRLRSRDLPGALMAGGMAAMAPGMAGIGPMVVHGPWWAAAFVLVALWPLARPWLARLTPRRRGREAGPVCGGPVAHLLGGAAMIYMCLLPMHMPGGATGGAALTAQASELAMHDMSGGHAMSGHDMSGQGMSGHDMSGMRAADEMRAMHGMGASHDMPGMTPMPGTAEAHGWSTPLALIGWTLAGYFLFGTVAALTRRRAPGASGGTLGKWRHHRATLLGEAVMGFGTVIMLVAMT